MPADVVHVHIGYDIERPTKKCYGEKYRMEMGGDITVVGNV
jgi:hypothetical protein